MTGYVCLHVRVFTQCIGLCFVCAAYCA